MTLISEYKSEWVSEYVSEWVSMLVCELGNKVAQLLF